MNETSTSNTQGLDFPKQEISLTAVKRSNSPTLGDESKLFSRVDSKTARNTTENTHQMFNGKSPVKKFQCDSNLQIKTNFK